MPSNFIRKQIRLYKSLQPCECPAIQETVHFTADGLNHLLFYRRRPRARNQKHYRAALISHITNVISNATIAVKEIKSEDPLVVIWCVEAHVTDSTGEQIVKVVLIKKEDGNVKFLSIMRKRYLNTSPITH